MPTRKTSILALSLNQSTARRPTHLAAALSGATIGSRHNQLRISRRSFRLVWHEALGRPLRLRSVATRENLRKLRAKKEDLSRVKNPDNDHHNRGCGAVSRCKAGLPEVEA